MRAIHNPALRSFSTFGTFRYKECKNIPFLFLTDSYFISLQILPVRPHIFVRIGTDMHSIKDVFSISSRNV